MRLFELTPPAPSRGLVVLDLDDTLWSSMTAMALVCRERFGIEHPDLERDIFATWNGITDHAGERTGEVFSATLCMAEMIRGGALPGAVEATHELQALGYRVSIMTHRLPEIADDTLAACQALGFGFDELRVGREDKVALCRSLGARVLIDDKPDTILAAHAAGLPLLTLAYPFNADARRQAGIAGAEDWVALRLQLLELLGEAAVAA